MEMEQKPKNPLQLDFGKGNREGELIIKFAHPHVTTAEDAEDMRRRIPINEAPLEEQEVTRAYLLRIEEEIPLDGELLGLWQKEDPELLPSMAKSLRARMDEEPILTGWQRELLNFSISEIEKNIPK